MADIVDSLLKRKIGPLSDTAGRCVFTWSCGLNQPIYTRIIPPVPTYGSIWVVLWLLVLKRILFVKFMKKFHKNDLAKRTNLCEAISSLTQHIAFILDTTLYTRTGYFVLGPLPLRSHKDRSHLWGHFWESLVFRLHSEIGQIHLSIEAQCDQWPPQLGGGLTCPVEIAAGWSEIFFWYHCRVL